MLPFPPDAQTIYLHIPVNTGANCATLIATSSNPMTILYSSINSNGANLASMRVGNNEFISNIETTGLVFNSAPITFVNQSITCQRANNKEFVFRLVYVPRNVLTSTTTNDYFLTNTTSTSITGGDTIISVLLLFILLFGVFSFLIFRFLGITIIKRTPV